MKTLHLTLKKKWFDMIASGEKKEEYRAYKDYWIDRLLVNGYIRHFDLVIFRNGYAKNVPEIILECKGIEIGKARYEWSEGAAGDVFVIKLGEIINL